LSAIHLVSVSYDIFMMKKCSPARLNLQRVPDIKKSAILPNKFPTSANKTGVLLCGDDSCQNKKSEKKIKKNPHHHGGGRQGCVYGKENRDTILLVTAGTTHCLQR
jgi:hypothetical protein